jgi:hypothetical protein
VSLGNAPAGVARSWIAANGFAGDLG